MNQKAQKLLKMLFNGDDDDDDDDSRAKSNIALQRHSQSTVKRLNAKQLLSQCCADERRILSRLHTAARQRLADSDTPQQSSITGTSMGMVCDSFIVSPFQWATAGV